MYIEQKIPKKIFLKAAIDLQTRPCPGKIVAGLFAEK